MQLALLLNPSAGGGGGTGTVTTVSVVSANGFSGSVATPTTTPAITITCSLGAGIVKSSGTGGLAIASASSDYIGWGGVSNPQNGEILMYSNGAWVNAAASGSGTGDVVGPAGATAGRFPVFVGSSGKEIGDSGLDSSSFQTPLSPGTDYIAPTTPGYQPVYLSTGLKSGGDLSLNADPTLCNIAAGVGIWVDNHTDPLNPVVIEAAWNDFIGISSPVLLTSTQSYAGMSLVAGVPTPVFTAQEMPDADRRDIIRLGFFDHPANVIQYCRTMPMYVGDIGAGMLDHMWATGQLTVNGCDYVNGPTGLQLKITAGRTFLPFGNYQTNHKSPHLIEVAENTACDVLYFWGHSAGWTADLLGAIDPDHYDDGSATLANVPDGKYTIQIISLYPPVEFRWHDIQYGQVCYNTKEEAGFSLYDTVALNPYNKPDLYRAFLIVKQGITDWTDPDSFEFVHAGRGGLWALGDQIKNRVTVINNLKDVETVAPAVGDRLTWNGLTWVNSPPISASAGAGISYYLCATASGVSTYETLSIAPDTAAEDDTYVTCNNNTVAVDQFATVDALGRTIIDAGVWTFHFYGYVDTTAGVSTLLLDIYSRTSGGTETLLFTAETDDINITAVGELAISTYVQTSYTIDVGDRLVLKVRAKTTNTSDTQIHLVHSGTENYSFFTTPLSVRHNDLSGLQGGSGSERYHLSAAEKTVVSNTSGTNTGDNAVNSNYSGLDASKQDTLVSGTNIKTLNSASLLGSGDIVITVPVKASGAEINTGTDDAKFATPKAIADANVAFLSDIPTVPVKAIGTEINTGTDDAKFATAKAIADSNIAFLSDIPTLPVKATGVEVNTGTDDAKFVTPKAIADSNVAMLSDIPTLPVKATGAEIDTGTDDAKFATALAIRNSGLISGAVGGEIAGLTDKPTPVDADVAMIEDSAASNAKKKLSWANIKATLRTYFDTLYNAKRLVYKLAAAVATSGTGETKLFSLTVPAAAAAAGSTFRIRMVGNSSSTGTLIFRIKVGANGTTADNQVWISTTSAAQVANARAGIDVVVTVRSATTAIADGNAHAGAVMLPTLIAAPATAAIVVSAQWFINVTCTCSVGTFTAQVGIIEEVK